MTNEATEKLIKQIYAALEHDTRINLHASHLQLSTNGRTILLEGVMEDIISKRIVANTAAKFAGEDHIEELLCVRGSDIGNKALRDKIEKAFDNEIVFRDCDIILSADGGNKQLRSKDGQSGQGAMEIVIDDGVVTLTGHVISPSHRRLAEVILWWIDGTLRVNNQLSIDPPRQDNDGELQDAVRMVLEKNRFIDHGQIGIRVSAGVVELTGHLASAEQRMNTLRNVWTVPGVRDVHDHID